MSEEVQCTECHKVIWSPDPNYSDNHHESYVKKKKCSQCSMCACDIKMKSTEIHGEKKEWEEIVMCVYHNCIRHRDPTEVKKLLMNFIGKLG